MFNYYIETEDILYVFMSICVLTYGKKEEESLIDIISFIEDINDYIVLRIGFLKRLKYNVGSYK